jgi:hypothetical protein
MAYGLDDWDLYMLRLVNRARQDPAGEAGRIGSSVTDASPPRPPLAYDFAVGSAATNHNRWMHDNFGSLASGLIPDSHTHFETTSGQQNGTPATGTPSFTGATVGDRITAMGFAWDIAAENILWAASSQPIPINASRVDANHKVWWESGGHRSNMLGPSFAVFGHHLESRAFTPPRGGLAAPLDNLHYATQNYARPIAPTKTYILGLLYRDLDASGAWTPRNFNDPLREGLGNRAWTLYTAGTTTQLATGMTLSTGSFSINRGSGTYDIEFSGLMTPLGKYRIENVTLAGQNVDAGDHNIALISNADFNGDRHVDGDDFVVFKACGTRAAVRYNTGALPPGCPPPYASNYIAPDFDWDQDVDLADFALFQRCYSGAAPANPNCG